jgi:hypothetical protein
VDVWVTRPGNHHQECPGVNTNSSWRPGGPLVLWYRPCLAEMTHLVSRTCWPQTEAVMLTYAHVGLQDHTDVICAITDG